jgi:hypothetical protein
MSFTTKEKSILSRNVISRNYLTVINLKVDYIDADFGREWLQTFLPTYLSLISDANVVSGKWNENTLLGLNALNSDLALIGKLSIMAIDNNCQIPVVFEGFNLYKSKTYQDFNLSKELASLFSSFVDLDSEDSSFKTVVSQFIDLGQELDTMKNSEMNKNDFLSNFEKQRSNRIIFN